MCKGLKILEGGCGDDQGGIVGVGVNFGVRDGSENVVDVEEEEGGGECAALRDAVRDGLHSRLCVLCVCGLLAVGEVGGEESCCVFCEVEVVSELVEKSFM